MLLLWVLLLATMSIAGLTFYALKGQRAELEETRRKSQEQALALLASRVEQSLFAAVEAPLLIVRNIPNSALSEERLRLLRALFSPVEEVLVLDRELSLVRNFPPSLDQHENRLVQWVARQVQEEEALNEQSHWGVRSFLDTIRGQPALLVIQPIRAIPEYGVDIQEGDADGWILLRFDLGALELIAVEPLLNDFGREQAGTAALYEPATDLPAGTLSTTLSRVLPGWTLAFKPQAASGSEGLGRQRWALIGAALGVVIAVALICVAIWWEIRREYALVELRNRFVANVSHELKTPLSLIRMYSETLYLKRLADPGRQHEYHRIILREAERLSRMIGGVLDFARLRQGIKVYELTETDLRERVSAVVQQYRPEWERRGVKVDLQISGEVPPVAHDPQGVSQVLLNLVDNAVKYGGSGAPVAVRLEGDAEWVELQVIDCGPGMTASQRAELQASARRGRMAEAAHGSGLGVALVEQIAEAHHAHFVLDTADSGGGLKAVVSFPTYKGAA